MPPLGQPSYEELADSNAELAARVAELLAVVAEQAALVGSLRAEAAALRRGARAWPGRRGRIRSWPSSRVPAADAGRVASAVQVHDMPPPALTVTEYRMMSRACGCGRVTAAVPPPGVTGGRRLLAHPRHPPAPLPHPLLPHHRPQPRPPPPRRYPRRPQRQPLDATPASMINQPRPLTGDGHLAEGTAIDGADGLADPRPILWGRGRPAGRGATGPCPAAAAEAGSACRPARPRTARGSSHERSSPG